MIQPEHKIFNIRIKKIQNLNKDKNTKGFLKTFDPK